MEEMLINIVSSKKKKCDNRLIIIDKNSELKKNLSDSKTIKYFKKELKKAPFAFTNENGQFLLVIKSSGLMEPGDRDTMRQHGAKCYQIVAASIKELLVISKNGKAAELCLEGMRLASYRFEKYLSEGRRKKVMLKKVLLRSKNADIQSVIHITDAVCWSRDLVNEPVSYLTASQLAEDMKTACQKEGVKVEVLKKTKIESLKMGGLLAVNKGSVDPPTFSILEWKPKNAINTKPIIFVGKGIVYDTGGLSLKPTANSMDFMKSDMGGAAAVAGATLAAAKLKLPIHLITLVPSTDNRPGGNAYAPGDIIEMFDGTTVEVLNTDAEGRMALADALAYAKKYDPELVVDAATLTGAAVRAVGTFGSVVMGNASKKEIKRMHKAGMTSYDRVVELPFWDDYFEEMKSDIADLKNLGGPFAGMITAGKFLEHFTDYPYIHIDLAGPAYFHSPKGYQTKGGTGAGVRLLTEFLKDKVREWNQTK